jgi:hypothetical protein
MVNTQMLCAEQIDEFVLLDRSITTVQLKSLGREDRVYEIPEYKYSIRRFIKFRK